MGYLLDNWFPFVIPVAIILMALLIFSVVKLRNNRALAEKLCYYILGFLFMYKLLGYIIYCVVLKNPWYEQLPVEISQVSYFIVPIAFLSQNKWIKDGSAVVGILAGFIQLLSTVVAPYRFVEAGRVWFDFFESTLLHYMLLWGGIIQICCIEQLKIKNVWKTLLVIGLIISWGALAGNTWMFGTDPGHPDEPANIGFTQRVDMLPDEWVAKSPWVTEHHLFLIPFFFALLVFISICYLLSYLSMRNVAYQQPSMYGLGWSGFRKFMKTDIVAPKEDK